MPYWNSSSFNLLYYLLDEGNIRIISKKNINILAIRLKIYIKMAK